MVLLGIASDTVRNQVMRYDPFTGVFNGTYINHTVRFNMQDAFLESNISDNGLTRAFTYMSIRCNPGAPKEVPNGVMERLFAADPEIVDLERRFKASATAIKWEYKFIKRAPKEKRKEYEDLRKQLMNAKKSLRTDIEEAYRKDYFFQIHNEMMKRQLQRHLDKTTVEEDAEDDEDTEDAKDVEPIIDHPLEERTRLQQVLCDLSKDLSPQAIVARKVTAINLMIALASRQEFQTRKPRSAPASKDLVKRESPAPAPAPAPFPPPDEFPVVCEKTQCIICIGNERLPYIERMRTFKRVSHMWDHVEDVHLRHVPAEQRIICHYPVYKAKGEVLNNVMHFKNHVARVHKIDLRPKVFPY
jgi:hypothetical protein